MICVNELNDLKCNKLEILKSLTIILSPFAPHIAEELWSTIGNSTSITEAEFPTYDESLLVENTKTYPISFNGKVRFTIDLATNASKNEIEKAAMEHEKAKQWLDGKTPKKVIVVPGKIVNIVV